MLATVTNQSGGIATKLLVGLFVVAIVASIGAYLFLRNDTPLALSPDATVDVNRAVEEAAVATDDGVVLTRGGEVYVATFVRNDGRFPVTLQGVGDLGEIDAVPYIPSGLRLGDGSTPDPDGTAVFSPQTLDPGEGIGVLVIYTPNPDLRCQVLPEEPVGRGTAIDGFPLEGSVYGVTFTQDLEASEPFARVAPATQAECEAAFTDAT
jgi:hypothetical protein